MATETLTGLTAIFTPPASCRSSWTYEAEFYNSVEGGLLLQNALSVDLAADCFPPDFGYFGRVPYPTEVYSPGACPVGYATATLSFNAETTLAVCCQSGFSYTSTFSEHNQFNTTSVLFAGCTSTYPSASGSTVVPNRDEQTLNTTTVTGPIIMWGQPISIEFQQTDLALFTTTTSGASTESSVAQPSRTGTSSPATGTSGSSSSTNSGFSSGAKAGISIAVAIVVLAFLAAVVFLFLRRRRKVMGSHPSVAMQEDSGPRWQRQELDATSYQERPQELDGTYTVDRHKVFSARNHNQAAELE